MPVTLQAFIWVLGIGVIGVSFAIIGFLLKDKLNAIMKEMQEFRADVIELFKEDKAKVKAIEEIKGDIKAINERCKTIKCIGE